ncbi:hypothetical protein RSOLAG22IIIB_11460 [Rhizoctonia solani]|uniref:Uncharacterized protein n=1 Tax=Rhizoctonia solani TaxID=456999 RepID=A0A0K6G8T2_9AGAM|nr:hypothetical protein RSOLAG22IIIB_11460 [Rhizoctonia solani]
MPDTYWTYFISREDLVETYKLAGGNRGTQDHENPSDITIAAHGLFLYLMAPKLMVWLAFLDKTCGIAFILGNANDTFGQAMYRSLAERCHKVFGCPPDQWTEIEGTDPIVMSLEKDGETHRLKLLLLRESEQYPRDYPPEI